MVGYLFLYDASSVVGAYIQTWVPSMAPITLGNPPILKFQPLFCFCPPHLLGIWWIPLPFPQCSCGIFHKHWQCACVHTIFINQFNCSPSVSPTTCSKLPIAENCSVYHVLLFYREWIVSVCTSPNHPKIWEL